MNTRLELLFALTALTLAAGCSAATRTPARFVGGERVLVEVQGGGVVTSPGGDVSCGAGDQAGCRADFTGSGPTLLSAKADPGWRFKGWQVARAGEDGSIDPGFLPSMDGPRTRLYRAVFVRTARGQVAVLANARARENAAKP